MHKTIEIKRELKKIVETARKDKYYLQYKKSGVKDNSRYIYFKDNMVIRHNDDALDEEGRELILTYDEFKEVIEREPVIQNLHNIHERERHWDSIQAYIADLEKEQNDL